MSTKRYSMFPVHHQNLWHLYEKIQQQWWFAHEVKFTNDHTHLASLTEDERYFLKHVIAFFNQADGIVNENLALRFYNETLIPEARAFYGMQIAQETIHSHIYSQILEEYYKHDPNKDKLFDAISHFPAISKKAQWAAKWINSQESFSRRLIAFAVVEGVFFSGSFCSIYWFKSRGMLEGLSTANKWIARDENLHCQFAIELYNTLLKNHDGMLNNGVKFEVLNPEVIIEIFREAVEVEQEFLTEALPVDMIGMNKKLMKDYIECCADYWLERLGLSRIYNKEEPFGFMASLGMESKTNFFEKTVTEYSMTVKNLSVSFDEEF